MEDSIISVGPRPGSSIVEEDDIIAALEKDGQSIALVIMGGVHYYSGQAFDMKAITAAAHAQGCTVGFDLAHAVGNIELKLHDWNVDFACWVRLNLLVRFSRANLTAAFSARTNI